MKTCAIVVTFNRKNLLKQQMDEIAKQKFRIDDYYIVDNNSGDGTDLMIQELKKNFPIRLHYLRLTNNVGGAGGFCEGLIKAYEDSYDWFILMDDDGRPFDEKCFSEVFDFVEQKKLSSSDLYLLNSLVTHDNVGLSFGLGHIETIEDCEKHASDGLFIGTVNPFNGTVLSNGLVKKIGFPNGEFFIKGDEVDYLRRAKKNEAFVATITSSRYMHPKPQGMTQKRVFGKKYYMYIEAPWKEYYNVRNQAYSLIASNEKSKARIFAFNRILCCLFCKCEKLHTLKMIFRGYSDAKKGRLGAIVKPGE